MLKERCHSIKQQALTGLKYPRKIWFKIFLGVDPRTFFFLPFDLLKDTQATWMPWRHRCQYGNTFWQVVLQREPALRAWIIVEAGTGTFFSAAWPQTHFCTCSVNGFCLLQVWVGLGEIEVTQLLPAALIPLCFLLTSSPPLRFW